MFVYIQNYVYILCYINVWYTLLYMNILISILTNMIIYEVDIILRLATRWKYLTRYRRSMYKLVSYSYHADITVFIDIYIIFQLILYGNKLIILT